MILSPRDGGPPILTIEAEGRDPLTAIARQHRRLATLVQELDDQAWATPSRCDGWAVRDVVAHLAGVNAFWSLSIRAGLTGRPTEILDGFDPAATPPLLIGQVVALARHEVAEQFVSSSETLLDILAGLDDAGWSTVAESPAGHVPIALVVQHALWDSWVHERDIMLPLGLSPADEPDEVGACLRYAAAVSPVLGLGLGRAIAGRYAVDATDPSLRFVLEVGDSIAVWHGPPATGVPCLRGGAVSLTEVLSLRKPLPPATPPEWAQLLVGLRTAFDAE